MSCEEEQPPAPLSSTVTAASPRGQHGLGTRAKARQPLGRAASPRTEGTVPAADAAPQPPAPLRAHQPAGSCASSLHGPSRRDEQDAVLVIKT